MNRGFYLSRICLYFVKFTVCIQLPDALPAVEKAIREFSELRDSLPSNNLEGSFFFSCYFVVFFFWSLFLFSHTKNVLRKL